MQHKIIYFIILFCFLLFLELNASFKISALFSVFLSLNYSINLYGEACRLIHHFNFFFERPSPGPFPFIPIVSTGCPIGLVHRRHPCLQLHFSGNHLCLSSGLAFLIPESNATFIFDLIHLSDGPYVMQVVKFSMPYIFSNTFLLFLILALFRD